MLPSHSTKERGLQTLLPVVGLISGLVTIAFVSSAGRIGAAPLAGLVFGALIALCFALSGIPSGAWNAMRLIGVSTVAYFVSFFVAFAVEFALAPYLPETERWSMGHIETGSPVALFAGGAAGGFLVIGEILHLLYPQTGARVLALKAASWSVLSGALAALGWALGPSLGSALWNLFHALHLTPPISMPWDDLYGYGEARRVYSLLLVWQTGVAAAITIMLRNRTTELGRGD